jgi:uncharacterized membrane protein
MQFSTNPVQVKNLGLVERWASIVGGAVLVTYGVKKRSKGGTLLAMAGSDLIYCGTTGYSPLFRAFGFTPLEKSLGRSVSIPYQHGIRVDKSITVDKPRDEVFAFWRNLENLPRFMQHVHSVTTVDDKRSHWIVRGPSCKIVEWDAEIINEQPNELIAWRSIPGSDVDCAGSVLFKQAPGGRGAEVLLELQYLPPGGAIGAAIAKLMGENPANQIKEDLRRFKQLMETGEISTIEGQPHGKEGVLRQRPARARRVVRVERHRVDNARVEAASEESFPASDPPAWTAPQEELVS